MAHRPAPVAAFTLVGVGLVDGVEVGLEADLARTRDSGQHVISKVR